MAIDRYKIEVDPVSLNDILAALAVHRDRINALGQAVAAQAQAQKDTGAPPAETEKL